KEKERERKRKERKKRKTKCSWILYGRREGREKKRREEKLTFQIDVNATNQKLRTALHCAVLGNQVEVVTELLKVPTINLNAVDTNGKTALHLSCYKEFFVRRVCFRCFCFSREREKQEQEHRQEQTGIDRNRQE